MAFAAKVVLDSISPFDKRLITVEATYPRFVHAEVLTHRDRERNSASSRAIPWISWRPKFEHESEAEYAGNKAEFKSNPTVEMLHEKCMKGMILRDPVVPLKFGMEQKGMQKGNDIPPHLDQLARELWLAGRDYMVDIADMLYNIGETYDRLRRGEVAVLNKLPRYDSGELPIGSESDPAIKIHKSLANRLTEPWMWITVVMTATEWNNFFRLRCHPAAEQHFFKIANMIRDEIRVSTPKRLKFGEIHAPYVTEVEQDVIRESAHKGEFGPGMMDSQTTIQAISTGRCARVSYLTHDGKRDFKKDIELYNTLLKPPGDPDEDIMHASPFGHVAVPATADHRSGPFIGWKQFRKQFPNENVEGVTV